MILDALWPYAVIVLCGFLPTEVWRVLGVLLGRGFDEQSEAVIFVRMVATGLVAAVVAKLLLSPIGALGVVPVGVRVGAVVCGIAIMLGARRSILAGLLAGEIVLVAAAWMVGRGGA